MILYIGNNIKSKSVSVTTISALSKLLENEGYEIKMSSSKENQYFRLLSMLRAIIKYRTQINHVLIDTYSTKNFYYALATSQLCRFFKLKYIPILHGGDLPHRLDDSPKFSRLIFANSYINIAPSNYLESEFNKRGYTTLFIPNVLEIKDYDYLERDIKSPKLLYVRAFAHIYNPEMAIKVLSELKTTYPEALLCMIGPEKDASFDSCKSLVKSLGLENNVEFTGMLTKPQWHEKAKDFNVFINTTNIDNTPISVMEAMALGLPVVSTNVGGIPYVIKDEFNGLLVNRNDVEEMTKAIIRISQNQEVRINLTKNARREVEQFDWNKVKVLWQKVLQ